MKRTLVIGDIHGGLKALRQLLEKANVVVTDKLIFLGDYVDGWSESAAVVDFLLALKKSHECIFIKGNHDIWCEEWLSGGTIDTTWLMHGGEETLNSYADTNAATRNNHLIFFEQMPYYLIDVQNRLFVHAGFTANYGPQKELNPANVTLDRTLWETAISLNKHIKPRSIFFPKRLKLFHEIYIGHTPTLYYDTDTPMQACDVWNLDTGAAFTGKLSMMDIDTKQYWQSDPVYQLYPDEMGRNKI
ncbi:metallophosphoesterase family protein [Ferruginibacter sp.]|uniref:metallophosphoesterase family protein n=1 Tax=Ferruginibacter sp. TaxID=1940288 RepID=UPI00265B3105|nr:metallophosphoesterase family protein [Ferruginibacter sp.]